MQHWWKNNRSLNGSYFWSFLKYAALICYFLAWLLYFFIFWSNSFVTNEVGGISAQHINLWGDWAAHFTMGSAMAERGLILDSSPFLLDAPFSYPFVADMLSAILIRLNFNFFMAFILPSFLFSFLLVVTLFVFYKLLSKSGAIAILASIIFLLNGGSGFMYYFSDIAESPNQIETALTPPRKYTNIEDKHYRWISVINSMVIPQRAFTVGFPIALLLLTFIFKFSQEKESRWQMIVKKVSKKITFLKRFVPPTPTKNSTLFFATAAILGVMPIIHTHSFLALFVILFFWMLADLVTSKNWQNLKEKSVSWLTFVGIVAVIALPLIKIFIQSNISGSFIKWYPGWYAGNDYPDETLLSFWFKNWTIVPLLSFFGFVVEIVQSKQKRATFLTYIPFFVLFVLVNLFLFQPFVWDNTKILVWASLGFSYLTAIFLLFLWKKHWLLKPLVVLTLVFITFSGFLDTYRALLSKEQSFQMYSAEEIELVEWTKTNTSPDSIWMTGTYHNQWLFNLTGRQAVATYTGWLWTHGYDYYDQERDIQLLYANPQYTDILDRYNVSYIVLGPFEKDHFDSSSDLFKEGYRAVKATPNYTIFERIR